MINGLCNGWVKLWLDRMGLVFDGFGMSDRGDGEGW